MPLTKWDQVKAELVEMWQFVRLARQNNMAAAKRLVCE